MQSILRVMNFRYEGIVMWLLYAISGLVGVSLIIIGYLIKYKKKTSLINDYKIKNIRNEDGYISWIGKSEIIIGIVMTLLTIIAFIFNRGLELAALDGVLIITLIVLLISGDRKYKNK